LVQAGSRAPGTWRSGVAAGRDCDEGLRDRGERAGSSWTV